MIPRSYAGKALRPEMTVRQIAADFPESQEVFRRHGETDPPTGRFGHLEPLAHFAQRHDITLDALLQELSAATGIPVDRRGRFAERVHHRFILAALFFTLTFGAGWGAILLWQLGGDRGFNSVPAAYVIAHGEAQLWGFVVLFVIGISLRTVLQEVARRRWGVVVVNSLLALALFGVIGGLAWSLAPGRLPLLGVFSAASLCLLASGIWAIQALIVSSKWRSAWSRAVIASGFWLTTWAGTTLWLRWTAGAAGPGTYADNQRMLLIVLAVFGFALNSIYGFGQMLLPGLLRIGKVNNAVVELALALHNAGTLLLCLATAQGVGGLAMGLGGGLLIVGAATFAGAHRGFIGRPRTSYRDEQGHAPLDLYPPLAFGWLIASLFLLTGGLLFESVAGRALPHAYMGAVRHALTVGFLTTLILGVGQRLMPVLDRTVLALPSLTVPILALIGVGNLLRVASELAILATPAAFGVMPISGFLEWCALLLFALSMIATMFHTDALLKKRRVTKRSSIAVLLARHPWIEDRLRSGGTGYLERTRSLPTELTIGSFAESERYDGAELVERINGWLAEEAPEPTLDAGGR